MPVFRTEKFPAIFQRLVSDTMISTLTCLLPTYVNRSFFFFFSHLNFEIRSNIPSTTGMPPSSNSPRSSHPRVRRFPHLPPQLFRHLRTWVHPSFFNSSPLMSLPSTSCRTCRLSRHSTSHMTLALVSGVLPGIRRKLPFHQTPRTAT